MSDILGVCGKIIQFQKNDEVDVYAEKQLKTAYYGFQSARKVPMAGVRYVVNGKKRLSLLESILEFDSLEKLEIHFFKPNMKQNWDYDAPTKKIVLLGRGLGGVETFRYDPYKLDKWDLSQGIKRSKAMIRGFISEFYFPRSIKTKTRDSRDALKRIFVPELMTLEKLWQVVRTTGVVPFSFHVCIYTQQERFTYDIDLVNNRLTKDFRSGSISIKERVERSSMDNFNFDRILASTDMKDLVKRVFITLYDMENTTASDISYSFGITETMAKNCLDAIASRGYADKIGTPPREIYEINSENLKADLDD